MKQLRTHTLIALALMLFSALLAGCQPRRPGSPSKGDARDAQRPVPDSATTHTPATGKDAPSQAKPKPKTAQEALAKLKEEFQAGVKQAAGPPPKECRWTAEPIKIDGRADELTWRAADLIDSFALPWLGDKQRPPRTATKARLLWDREYLYFFAEMEDSDLYADVTEDDGQTWDNDVFELFFKPHADKPGYYEFQVNAAGTKMDMFLPRRNAGGFGRFKAKHPFHMEAAVVRRGTLNDYTDQDQGWSVEGRLPWSDFAPTGGGPKVDDVWTFALCRYDYSVAFEGPDLSSSAPLGRLNFHRHEDYAPLRFIGPQGTARRRSYGIDRFVACTTSRVIGSPEPPLPYRPRPAFEKLKIRQPLIIYPEPGTNNLLVVQHLGNWRGPGRILRIKDDANVDQFDTILELDYIAYALAFDPDYEQNGYIYVGCNGPVSAKNKKTRVARYTVGREAPYHADPKSEHLIIDWESDGHNGGDLGFSPTDGMLYITSGDGTSDSDTNLTGQDITNLCATVIRIDVHHPEEGRAYAIPKDNPFWKVEGARPEIWAFGFRNPWRMTFDRKTGHLWVTQNGQDLWEQGYLVERGANYGWSVYEGSYPFYLEREQGPAPIQKPTFEHSHSEARSLTGGIVYYGKKLPELVGAYIYGDYSTGKIWAIKHDGRRVTWHQEIADTTLQIAGFGTDHAGELIVVDQGGGKQPGDGFYRLEPTPPEFAQADFPRRLSATGLFASVEDHRTESSLIPYSVNASQWCDGAEGERFMALPALPNVALPSNRGWDLPEATVLIKTLSMEMEAGVPASRTRLETQMLTRQQGEWHAYTYEWNDDQTDALLVGSQGKQRTLNIKDAAAPGGVRKQAWHFASRSECMSCHSRAAKYVLGITQLQLNKDHDYGRVVENQLRTFAHLGMIRDTSMQHEPAWYAAPVANVQRPAAMVAGTLNSFMRATIEQIAARKTNKTAAQAISNTPANPGRENDSTTEADSAGQEKQKQEPKPADKSKSAAPSQAKSRPIGNLAQDAVVLLPDQIEIAWHNWPELSKQIPTSWLPALRGPRKLRRAPEELPHLVNPYDTTADLDVRVRSYLHANCSQCHVNAGGGNAAMELEFGKKADETKLIGEKPRHATFGMADARLVAPGDPYRSVLYYRLAKLGSGRMPRVGSNEVDRRAVRMIHDWIRQVPATAGEKPAENVAAQPANKPKANPDGKPDAKPDNAENEAQAKARADRIAQRRKVEAATVEKLQSSEDMTADQRDQAIDGLLASTSGSLLLIEALDRAKLPEQVRSRIVSKGSARTEPAVRDLFEPFLPLDQRTKRLGTLVDSRQLLALTGNAERGKHLWFNVSTVQCKSCHRIGDGEESLGPDLTKIGGKNTKAQLLESILEPSKKIDQKYQAQLVVTNDGRVLTGLLVSQSDDEIVLRDAKNKRLTLKTTDIDAISPSRKSLMPELLIRELTAPQVADLLAFLASMK